MAEEVELMGAKRPYPTDPWQEHPGLCNSRKTDGSGLCRRSAGQGTEHSGIGQCSKHGGCTQSANAHAGKVRRQTEMAELLAAELQGIEIVDPLAAVMDVVRDSWARMRVYQALIGDLLAGPADERIGGLYGEDHLGDLAVHPLVTMLERETTRHLAACKVAIDQGIAERVLRIEEDKLDLMIRAVRAILEGLGHSMDDPHVQEVVVAQLRALPTGDAA